MSSKKSKINKKSKNEPQEDAEEVSEKERQERFERELIWCIEQLELGLANTKKPDSKQSVEAMKILRVLRSATAPLVKKRQAMRNAFGDYRKKMQEEEKKYAMTAKSISLKAGHKNLRRKAQFLKKSTHYRSPLLRPTSEGGDGMSHSESATTACTESQRTDAAFKWTPSKQNGDDNFQFNFNLDQLKDNGQSNMEGVDVNQMVENAGIQLDEMDLNTGESQNNAPRQSDGLTSGTNDVSVNYFKLPVSSNSFRFNFEVS